MRVKTNYILPILLVLVLISCDSDTLLNPSDQIDESIVMDIQIDEDDYGVLLANRSNNLEVPCKIFYHDKSFIGLIRGQGAGSRYLPKWAYKISLTDGNQIEGLTEFNLSAQVYDPTMVNTTVASRIYKELGFPMFESKHVFLKINNRDQGLYPIIERVEQPFFNKRNLPVSELFKLGFDSRFTLTATYNPQFYFSKEIPDDDNYNSLLEFINALDTSNSEKLQSSLENWLNIDNYLTYHSTTSVINNFDAFRNNFFLYRPQKDNPFEIIPWDFDKCFYREDQVDIFGENEIILKLFENETYVTAYKEKVKYLLGTLFTENYIFPIIDSTASVIRDAYQIDPYLGGRYNLTEEVNTLKNYISQRRQYLLNNIDSFDGKQD